jgi:hypothetical protein
MENGLEVSLEADEMWVTLSDREEEQGMLTAEGQQADESEQLVK